jgi:hypothetical protein
MLCLVPNKTIYVKNEELWNKAKAIAGKEGEGLSGVIAEALAGLSRNTKALLKVKRFIGSRSPSRDGRSTLVRFRYPTG